MKIIVCVKQVPDVSVPLDIDDMAKDIVQYGLVFVVNPADLCAVETAVRLKERLGRGDVTVITLGPARAEAALRDCLAIGADSAIHLRDRAFDGSDPYATTVALSRVISNMEHNLILCGSQSLDGGSAQVAPCLAELLNLPQISAVTQLEVSPDCQRATVHRKLPRGNREVVDCPLPAVFSVEAVISEPRYPSLPALMEALQKEIQVLDLNSLGLSQSQVGKEGSLTKIVRVTPPLPRPKKTFVPESTLPAAERLRLIMAGGVTQKKDSTLLEGDSDKLANDVLHFLRDHGVIKA